MDVRCDRCETEYELDDDSVSEGGASVQCTTCGHTFVVGQNGETIAQIVPTPPAGLADLTGPQAADWLMATEDGETHRFRDLTTLQKWIVERKATRGDRVSQRGGPWRPLAEVDELAPFFDVVDQADRARSSGAPAGGRRSGSRSPAGAMSRPTPTRQTTVARPGAARSNRQGNVDFDGDPGALSARLDSDSTASATLEGFGLPSEEDDKFETMSIFRYQRRLKIAGIITVATLAVVAAFIGFSRPQWLGFSKGSEAVKIAGAPPAGAGNGEPAPPRTPASAAPPSAAPPGAAPSLPAPGAGHAGPIVAPMPSSPSPSPSSGAGGLPAPAGRTEPGALAVAGAIKGKTYERLVSDADRLMENGQPARAQRLLDQALLIQPNGVAALSGVAYLQLDRQRPLAAISTFKRALGYSPEFAPALFGLAEAYRAQGDLPQAGENYRKYIGVAPGGPDAPAARRQLKELDSVTPRRAPAMEAPPAAKGEEPSAAVPTAPAP
jgi:predicted Zn finger-like uncharacterized protein